MFKTQHNLHVTQYSLFKALCLRQRRFFWIHKMFPDLSHLGYSNFQAFMLQVKTKIQVKIF